MNSIETIKSLSYVHPSERNALSIEHLNIDHDLYRASSDDKKARILAIYFASAWANRLFIRPDHYDIPESIRDHMWSLMGIVGCLTEDKTANFISKWLSELYTKHAEPMYHVTSDTYNHYRGEKLVSENTFENVKRNRKLTRLKPNRCSAYDI